MGDARDENHPAGTDYWNDLAAIFKDHFPLANLDYDWEAYWIEHTIWSMPWDAWDHDKVSRQLDEIERALRILARDHDLPQAISDAFAFDVFWRSQGFEGEFSPSVADRILPDLHKLLAPSIRVAKSAVLEGDEGSQTGWEAINAIDACRISWWRCTGLEAPISIDLAAPFGKFVQDIFEIMGIKGKPRSAIDSWWRVQSKKKNT